MLVARGKTTYNILYSSVNNKVNLLANLFRLVVTVKAYIRCSCLKFLERYFKILIEITSNKELKF